MPRSLADGMKHGAGLAVAWLSSELAKSLVHVDADCSDHRIQRPANAGTTRRQRASLADERRSGYRSSDLGVWAL
ncbi:MAG: hypothetical protein AB8G26_03545 [Ilumatobacter sp.]